MTIQVKRAYSPPSPDDGFRVLVDRLWPRGVTKEALALDVWLKDIAPSDATRREFHGHPDRWEEFKTQYYQELAQHAELANLLLEKAREGRVTLIYAAKGEAHNNAVALREYLEQSK